MAKAELFSKSATQRPGTLANLVRDLLDELEVLVTQIDERPPDELLQIPRKLDEVTLLLERLREKGGHWEPEVARLETIAAQFEAQSATFLKRVGGPDALAERRADEALDPTVWWWNPEALVSERRRKRIRRIVFWAVGILAVGILLVVGYQRFLAPDPAIVEAIAHEMEAEHLVTEEDDIAAALTEVNVGLTYDPENVDLLIFKGVLHEALGETAAAAPAYAEAERLAEDRERFLTSRAQRHLLVGNEEEALADARRLLEVNPDSAHVYYIRGLVAERREEWVAAYGNYETASELAMDANQSEFYVFLRARMAEVLRKLPVMSTPSTETPTE